MSPFRSLRRIALALVVFGLATGASAWELSGRKTLTAHPREGAPIVLGHVTFTPRPDGSAAFVLAMDTQRFTDHFLSMKEFKCLEAAAEITCHVPYPYPNPGTVRKDDLRWLEHSLLFLFKQPKDFGAKLWNGLYYLPAGHRHRPRWHAAGHRPEPDQRPPRQARRPAVPPGPARRCARGCALARPPHPGVNLALTAPG